MYNGIINVYKERGYTSHDAAARLRGILGQKKIGHTGTLDPDAEGVLPMCLGTGTRLVSLITDWDKEYVCELMLGITTDTQDMSGKTLCEMTPDVTEDELEKIIASFEGDYEQTPPMYSALKVNGKKLYELAREGKSVDRAPRRLHIEEIEILDMSLPVVKLRVVCSKGTYIRTLCDDIGKKAGCGAAMSRLERSRVGRFLVKDALKLDKIEELARGGGLFKYIIKPDEILGELGSVKVKTAYIKRLMNGNCLTSEMVYITKQPEAGEQLRVYDEEGAFYGIYRFNLNEAAFYPFKMFLPPQ